MAAVVIVLAHQASMLRDGRVAPTKGRKGRITHLAGFPKGAVAFPLAKEDRPLPPPKLLKPVPPIPPPKPPADDAPKDPKPEAPEPNPLPVPAEAKADC